jgi:hybrid cluster-associated redox disulfide protein
MESITIGPQLSISELLSRWPETIPVFFQNHMLCVGCSMANFDNLEDAASNYAIPWEVFHASLIAVIHAASSRGT